MSIDPKAPQGEPGQAQRGPSDQAASEAVRALLSQARREALISLQRLEDVEQRAALDPRLQDDRLDLRLEAIAESRRRLIAVLPLAPGGGPAPLPQDATSEQAEEAMLPEIPSPDASAFSLSAATGAAGRDRARHRGGVFGLGRHGLLALAAAAFLIVTAAYLLGTLQRDSAGLSQARPDLGIGLEGAPEFLGENALA